MGHEQLLQLVLKSVCPSLSSIQLSIMWAWRLKPEHVIVGPWRRRRCVWRTTIPGLHWLPLDVVYKRNFYPLNIIGIWGFLSFTAETNLPTNTLSGIFLRNILFHCSNFMLLREPGLLAGLAGLTEVQFPRWKTGCTMKRHISPIGN